MTLTGLRSISEILGVLLILDCVLFVLKFFTKQLFSMISYLKSIAKIPQILIFVINTQNLLLIFFAIVTLFGMSCSRLLKATMILILLLQILIRFSVLLVITFWPIYFYALNHIYSCRFQSKRYTFSSFKILVKNNRNVNMLLLKGVINFLLILKNESLIFKYKLWS